MYRHSVRIVLFSLLAVPLLLLGTPAAHADGRVEDKQTPILPGGGDYIKDVSGSQGGHELANKGRRGGTGNGRGDSVVVPEPGTIALLGLGLAGLQLARRRKSQ